MELIESGFTRRNDMRMSPRSVLDYFVQVRTKSATAAGSSALGLMSWHDCKQNNECRWNAFTDLNYLIMVSWILVGTVILREMRIEKRENGVEWNKLKFLLEEREYYLFFHKWENLVSIISCGVAHAVLESRGGGGGGLVGVGCLSQSHAYVVT